jgi:hypothetical protein
MGTADVVVVGVGAEPNVAWQEPWDLSFATASVEVIHRVSQQDLHASQGAGSPLCVAQFLADPQSRFK